MHPIPRIGRLARGLALVALPLLAARSAEPAIFGVPTALNADGTPSGTSVDPPGYFGLDGTNNDFTNGEGVHQEKLFIEVTGTTLDILVFDPGASGALDITGNASQYTFTLFSPTGTTIATATIGNEVNLSGGDAGTTDDRLVRFTPPCAAGTNSCGWFRPNSASANNVSFSGLTAGLYEFRITSNGGTESNLYGVQFAVSKGANGQPSGSLNAYTTANSDTDTGPAGVNETSFLAGPSDSGTPAGDITQPMVMFPYVNRGCTVQTSNFDMDANNASGTGSSGALLDALGVSTTLTMSNNTAHAENNITIENATVTNLESRNYGMYQLTNNTGSQNNAVDWRVSDFQGSNSNGAAFPVNPVNPVRVYLPSAYAPVTGNPNATAPPEPTLTSSARVASGTNPPQAGSQTRFVITATVDNCAVRNATNALNCDTPSNSASTNVQITIPLATNMTQAATGGACTLSGIGGLCQECRVNGVNSACTVTNNTGSFTATFANLAATDAASFDIEVNYAPPAGTTGVQNLTGAPAAGAPPPNSTVWARYTSANRTETLGPVCNLTASVGAGAALLTRATLRGIRIDPAGWVEFVTGTQNGTAAFNLYATRDRLGRGPLALLNFNPIRPATPNSLTPLVYRVPTRPIGEGYVLVEEVDLKGRRRLMGPFAVGDEHLASAFLVSEKQAGDGTRRPNRRTLRSASGHRGGRGGATASARGLKLEVSQAGPVSLSLTDLQRQGLPDVKPSRLRLTSQGRAVPFDVGGGVLRFTAETLSTDYTGENVYVLTWGDEPPTLRTRLTRSEPAVPRGFSRVEQSTIYLASAPEGTDPWLWDLLFGDGSTWPDSSEPELGQFDLAGLPSRLEGRVPVRVRFLGRTTHQHNVSASINGIAVGTLTFTGAVGAVLEGSVPGSALLASGNRLSINYTASGGPAGEMGLIYLDSLDLGVRLKPQAPVAVDRVAAFAPYGPLRELDYLILSYGDFLDAARRLADLERSAGYKTAVVDVERAYDTYSAGIVEAAALRELLKDAARGGRLKYVLLLGGDTFDTHDYLGTGAVAFVPSLDAWDGEFGRVPSENRYADLNGDGKPELAIGRLPARTAEEAALLVEKVAAGAFSTDLQLFAVDNQGPSDINFEAEADSVAGSMPLSDTLFARVQDGVGVARAALFAGLAQGVAGLHYFGHAGTQQLADEDLMTVDDMASLDGTPATNVFLWACEAQWYQGIYGRSLGESLLLVPRGGAVASFGPAGITDPQHQASLYQRVYQEWLPGQRTLGESIRRAKAAAVTADPAARPIVDGWNLLGDPAQVPAAPRVGGGLR